MEKLKRWYNDVTRYIHCASRQRCKHKILNNDMLCEKRRYNHYYDTYLVYNPEYKLNKQNKGKTPILKIEKRYNSKQVKQNLNPMDVL